MGLKSYGAIIGCVAVAAGVSQADKAANYTKSEAQITAATFDCYVEHGNRHLIERDTEDRAYIDCSLAPMAAVMNDFKPEHVKTRMKATYQYVSAIDGETYQKSFTKSDIDQADYQVGSTIEVYLHKTKPEKSRF